MNDSDLDPFQARYVDADVRLCETCYNAEELCTCEVAVWKACPTCGMLDADNIDGDPLRCGGCNFKKRTHTCRRGDDGVHCGDCGDVLPLPGVGVHDERTCACCHDLLPCRDCAWVATGGKL